jgi:YbbR domain-containing protein
MKKKITDNIPLKLMSVVVGILVWLIVVNVDNPTISRSFVISNVELANEAYIDDTGMVCMRDENQSSIRVTITGERKTVSQIRSDDIQAVADLQQAVSLDTDPVMIPITVTCSGISSSNISVWPQNLTVHLEEKVTNEYIVSVNSDSKPGKGYEIGVQTVSPEKVRITGPKSLMNKIDKVNVSVNVEGKTEDVTETASLEITDKNGETVSDSFMDSLRIDNNGKVTVTTKLWKVRSDVKLNVDYEGEPADGYVVDSITTVPETISVAGTTEALDALQLSGNTIWVQDSEVNVSGARSDVEVKVNISQFLPDDVKLTSGSSEEVWVYVNILPEGGKVFSIPTSNIQVNHKPDDLQMAFDIDRIEVRIEALDGVVEDLKEEDIQASIDLDGKEEGSYEVPVEISLPEGYQLISDVTTEVRISRISTVEENE